MFFYYFYKENYVFYVFSKKKTQSKKKKGGGGNGQFQIFIFKKNFFEIQNSAIFNNLINAKYYYSNFL